MGGVCLDAARPALATAADDERAQLETFNQLFMDQVKIGDALFHGDGATEKQMKVKLSGTGMACAMCHHLPRIRIQPSTRSGKSR